MSHGYLPEADTCQLYTEGKLDFIVSDLTCASAAQADCLVATSAARSMPSDTGMSRSHLPSSASYGSMPCQGVNQSPVTFKVWQPSLSKAEIG